MTSSQGRVGYSSMSVLCVGVKPSMAPPPPQGGLLVREREKNRETEKQRNDAK